MPLPLFLHFHPGCADHPEPRHITLKSNAAPFALPAHHQPACNVKKRFLRCLFFHRRHFSFEGTTECDKKSPRRRGPIKQKKTARRRLFYPIDVLIEIFKGAVRMRSLRRPGRLGLPTKKPPSRQSQSRSCPRKKQL